MAKANYTASIGITLAQAQSYFKEEMQYYYQLKNQLLDIARIF